MLRSRIQKRLNLNFLNLNKITSKRLQMLSYAYEEDYMSHRLESKSQKMFGDSREKMSDDVHSATSITDKNME